MVRLSVVGTPIGNLEDITLRALRILKESDLILCEDTRMTKKLLSRYEITTPTLSYHAKSGLAKVDKIIDLLRNGKNLALVTDAGTPGISDPGGELVAALRTEFSNEELHIEAIPGPSALAAAISIAGFPAAQFVFLGFLPHKKGRETLFSEMAVSERTTIFYESPHRLTKTLERLSELLPERRMCVIRELTKIYESRIAGTAVEVAEHFSTHSDEVRGEIVVLVEGGR